jgi:hypothetical protein
MNWVTVLDVEVSIPRIFARFMSTANDNVNQTQKKSAPHLLSSHTCPMLYSLAKYFLK